MTRTIIKMGIAGRGQVPSDIREKLHIKEGDRLIVEIKEILKGDSDEHRQKKEAPQ